MEDSDVAGNVENAGGWRKKHLRLGAWGAAALMLLTPLVAMQFTEQVVWSVTDFAIFGAMLAGAGITLELAARMTRNSAYRAAVGLAVAAAFFLVWVNGAVGIIGHEGDPANLMYVGVLAVGVIGAVVARFRAPGMARALLATAVAQALVAAIAIVGGLGAPWSGPAELLAINGFFIALFVGSAWLFKHAAYRGPERGSA
jgi:hypothetical protein